MKKLISIQVIFLLSILPSCTSNENSQAITSPTEDESQEYTFETPEDTNAPYVRDEWINWIRANHQRVNSLDATNDDDLKFIDPYITGKSLVLLGEVAHGIAEQNKLRVRLIRYLHRVHGFSVIAFECGLYDCYFTNRQIDALNSAEILKKALHPFWNTSGVLVLADYIKQSQGSANPLQLAGFDFHASGYISSERPQFLRDIALPVDSTLAETIYLRDKILVQRRTNRSYVDDYTATHYNELRLLYLQLTSLIAENSEFLQQYFDQETIMVAEQVAISISKYIHSRAVPASYIVRDRRMAETIEFLKENLFPGQKIIIWAHNGHIQKDLKAVSILPYGYHFSGDNMGYWLRQNYAQEMYAIGSLAYRGHINYGKVQDIIIRTDESIEAILYQARKKYYFVDLVQQTAVTGNSWMFLPLTQFYIHREDPYYMQYIAMEQYDGILFIDTVSEPQYLQ